MATTKLTSSMARFRLFAGTFSILTATLLVLHPDLSFNPTMIRSMLLDGYNDESTIVSKNTLRPSQGRYDQDDSLYNDRDLDLAVIGFPKTGTTTLMKSVLGQHEEINMMPYEYCDINTANGGEKLLEFLKDKPLDEKGRKYGIKCPTIVRRPNAIDTLSKISRSYTRLIIGVRHPILWFQSFYNYRVAEVYRKKEDLSTIPDPNKILFKNIQWKEVSLSYARFDMFLKQLAKVPLDDNELKEMVLSDKLWPKRISPNNFKIFLYTTEQLLGDGSNSTRQFRFQEDLQHFLRLESPFPDIRGVHRSNENNATHPEYMDICSEKFDRLRRVLLRQGRISSRWILKKFIKSDDVVVSDVDHFRELLKTWGTDPCQKHKVE
mmetsp:Transcript_16731/g.34945  ORF Transcript_16731/g.34945 Transcript_16731/m.34945 type:complete len:378 (-) Transcript_16731:266-1399(-)